MDAHKSTAIPCGAPRTDLSGYQDHDHEISKWLYTVLSLHHLEPDEVEGAFVDEIMSICPDHSGFTAFADCLLQKFIL